MTNPQYRDQMVTYLSPDMKEKLKRLAKKRNISLSEYVRKTMEEKMTMEEEGFVPFKDRLKKIKIIEESIQYVDDIDKLRATIRHLLDIIKGYQE